jgi:hypothetical protein
MSICQFVTLRQVSGPTSLAICGMPQMASYPSFLVVLLIASQRQAAGHTEMARGQTS